MNLGLGTCIALFERSAEGLERPLVQWLCSKGVQVLRRPPPQGGQERRAGRPDSRWGERPDGTGPETDGPFEGIPTLWGGPFLSLKTCDAATGATVNKRRRSLYKGGDKDALNQLRNSQKNGREASMALNGASSGFARRLPGSERRCAFCLLNSSSGRAGPRRQSGVFSEVHS